MIPELITATFLLGGLAGFYAGVRLAGHTWRKAFEEQRDEFAEKILAVERKCAQLGAAVLEERWRAAQREAPQPPRLQVIE